MKKFRWVALAVLFLVALPPSAAVFAQTATPTPTATATQTPDYRTFVAIGSVQLVAGTPDTAGGWLICDGSAVSRTTYARLFAIIGTTFGAGDGSTTFNLPDLRGRVPVGSGAGTGLTARTLGQTFGEETHTLTVTEMPSHNHTINDPGHTHTTNLQTGGGAGANNVIVAGMANVNSVPTPKASNSSTTGITINNTGGGAAFTQMQPSLVLNYVIWSGDRAMPTPVSIAAEQTVVITVVVVFPTHTATPTPTPTLTETPGPSPTWTPSPSPTVSTDVSYSVGSQAVMVEYKVRPGDAMEVSVLVVIAVFVMVALYFYIKRGG